MLKDNTILILTEETYLKIYPKQEKLDYFDYLAKIYQFIENNKAKNINFLEYIVSENLLNKFLEESNITVDQIREDISLLKELPLIEDEILLNTYPRVPDYLLRATEIFTLPLQIINNDPKKSMPFNNISLSDKTLQAIENILNQYCFNKQSFTIVRENLALGQSTKVADKLVSFHTFFDNDYKEAIIKSQNPYCDIEESLKDEVYINEVENQYSTIKILSIAFTGSFYEYRNFLYKSDFIFSKVLEIIQAEFNNQFKTNEYSVMPVSSNFVIADVLVDIYSEVLSLYLSTAIYKDTDNYDLSMIASEIKNPIFSKDYEGYLLVSCLSETVKIQNVTLELDKLRELHNKRFPGMPFPYDRK